MPGPCFFFAFGITLAIIGIFIQRGRDKRANFEYEIRSRGNADRLKLLFFELNELEKRHKEKRVKVSPYLKALSQAVNDVFITMGKPAITEYNGTHDSRMHWIDHAAKAWGRMHLPGKDVEFVKHILNRIGDQKKKL